MLSTFENPNKWLMPHQKLEGVSLMDHLFNRLNGTYPNKWRANFRDEQAIEDWRQAWAEAFEDEGITPNDVALGIKNCRRMFDWPPSLPEFLKACRPHLEASTAFFEATRGLQARSRGEHGAWSHPAIFFAALAVGQYEMRNESYPQLRVRWEKAFGEQLALGQWPEIPPVLEALPAPARTEEGKAQIRKVSSMASGALANSGTDHKRWAKRILKDPKGRSLFAVNAAKATLGEEALA